MYKRQIGYMSFTHVGCPIRKSPDQWPFAPTRSLSQLITSFIASESQGIRHAPLLTFFMTRLIGAVSLIRIFPPTKPILLKIYFCFLIIHTTCQRTFRLWFPTFGRPGPRGWWSAFRVCIVSRMVENNGFEPLTLCVQGRCSSQLS